MFDAECNFAAVVYKRDDDPDRLLLDFARDLRRSGSRVAGVIQHGRVAPSRHTTVRAILLPSEAVVDLGHERSAKACRLEAETFADIARTVAAAIGDGADLVIINRFGKLEAAGSGFAELIRQAVDADIPVLTAVPDDHFSTWVKYSAGMNVRLPCRRAALDQWWRSVARGGRAEATPATFCELAK